TRGSLRKGTRNVKIAFFAWESLHTVQVGAVATHVTELAAALDRRGHEVHVFARIGEGQRLYDVIDGVHYHRCPIDLDPDFVNEMTNMGRSLYQRLVETEGFQATPFDVVHAHDWLCSKGLVQAKNERGRHVVLTFHSTEFGRAGNRGPQSGRIASIEAEGAYVADRIITASAALADEVCWLYHTPNDKVRTIRDGIHCAFYDRQVDAGEVRKEIGIGPLDPTVLFSGRFCWDDGPDLLIDAIPGILEHRSDSKFVLVGDGEMRGYLEQRVAELGVGQSVRFLGNVPDLARLLLSVDVVCVPSRRESFGPRVLEAWAARRPVVVTYKLDVQDFVHHGMDGMVVYDNPPSICWGITTLFSDFEKARQIGDRGRVKAAYGYSWDVIAGQVEGVYRELL
ncbi:MAG TPA: glycosyltransferase family 4 protein, partial [Polyangiaceae bacterium]|nr:glycosyltransferase family 4 protein [Polyangiaceae bacterium]